MDGHAFMAEDGDRGEISRRGWINDNPIRAVVGQRLAAQIKHRAVKIEQIWKTEWLGSVGCRPFDACSRHTGIGKLQFGSNFLFSICLNLFALDRPKRLGINES